MKSNIESFDKLFDEEIKRLKSLDDLNHEHIQTALNIADKNLKLFKDSFESEKDLDEKIKIRKHYIDSCFKDVKEQVSLKSKYNYDFYEICTFLFGAYLRKN
ncbi:hypothetical protein [Winogradskyella eximia]|uniref:hypothetical protein n=1 Tax=Winogradskyella eximia TaxID=262006 RepID=UPI00248F8F40|nr:hypothetical protein [Winogradskyella eximia]